MLQKTDNNLTDKLVADMSIMDLSIALYHIARHTNLAQTYSVGFCTQVLLRASEELSSPQRTAVPKDDGVAQSGYPPTLEGLLIQDYTPPDLPVVPTVTPHHPNGHMQHCKSHGWRCTMRNKEVEHCVNDFTVICLCCDDGVAACIRSS